MFDRINFKPWVGPSFQSGPLRLLIVGESQYGEPDEDPAKSTTTVVEKWQSGEWNVRYLVAAARLLTGKERSHIDRTKDLDQVAFYNFVQVMLPDRRSRPRTEDFVASYDAFRQLLLRLNPTHTLATGYELWNNMPDWDGRQRPITLGGKSMELGEYATSDGYCLATNVPHLSIAFSPPEWKPAVDEFLALTEFPD